MVSRKVDRIVRCVDNSLGAESMLKVGGEHRVDRVSTYNDGHDMYHFAGDPEKTEWRASRFITVRDFADELRPPPPVAAEDQHDALFRFFSAPAEPGFCKCNIPRPQCKYHRD